MTVCRDSVSREFDSVSAKGRDNCGLKKDGSIVCWGVGRIVIPVLGMSAAEPTTVPTTAVSQSSTSESEDTPAAGDSGLYRAVWRGDVDELKRRLSEGANVNENDEEGNPYLHEAIWRGHLEVAQLLIEAGADVDAKDSDGDPLLYEAIWRGHDEIVQLLTDADADVDAKDSDDNPLLYTAIWGGHDEIVQLLIAAGADCTRARDAHHIGTPEADATEEELHEYLRELNKIGLAPGPWISGYTDQSMAQLAHAKHLGFDIGDVERSILAEKVPIRLEAATGRIDPKATETFLAACTECPEPEIREHIGIDSTAGEKTFSQTWTSSYNRRPSTTWAGAGGSQCLTPLS